MRLLSGLLAGFVLAGVIFMATIGHEERQDILQHLTKKVI